jgi:hypothetical protein
VGLLVVSFVNWYLKKEPQTMAKDRFKAANMRKRLREEGRASADVMRKTNRKSISSKRRRTQKLSGPKQSVEEFLASGGAISMCPPGSAYSEVDELFPTVTRRPRKG